MSTTYQDLIGREEFVGKVCALVDGLAADNHFCLAIDGDWGSGKTFVLNMIEEKLSAHDEYFIIRYDAWENSFYDDPLIAILSCIIDELQKWLSVYERIKTAGKESVSIAKAFLPSKIKEIIASFQKLICAFNQPFSKDTNQKKVGEFKSYQALLNEVKQKLKRIVDTRTKKGKQAKLVFLVDEIDRCLPNEQLVVLERMHHLLNVPNCAVVCAINAESITDNFESVYGVEGKDYLKKFFDFTYHLDMNSNEYLEKLLGSFEEKLRKIQTAIEWENEPVKQSYLCLLYGSKRVLANVDNRSLNRYYDSLQQVCNEYGWNNLNTYRAFFFIVGLFIRKNVSEEFLSVKDILSHPRKDSYSTDLGDYQMPFHDFLKDYTGLDRDNLTPAVLYNDYDPKLDAFSWEFNSIIAHSLNPKSVSPKNDFEKAWVDRLMPSNPENEKMRDLIIRYGGETRCEKKK